ncbi:hypothetical protein FOA43_003491 [Brettanomyces nanus]|uniref:Pre-mRNA-processing factor 39 n=1 Tax=Eeniella nana TaxID=13502 RepID=A0A875S727_EENNA|nr:uncharacterized protein FOA43_003491 [Brettanomyces nanus]QPG76105.1 hypothetical protein FOA43_003491 [Brettanomyces nanus]
MALSTEKVKYPEWLQIRSESLADPDNLVISSRLLDYIEDIVDINTDEIKQSEPLQQRAHFDFDRILNKFPYLTSYWKRYVTVEYALNGLESSALILERAVLSFPQCIDLWIDYINIVVANKLKIDSEVKKLFEEASHHVGRQYMSDPFWDLYLEWEEKHSGKNSNAYIDLYLTIIRIPLHQYARYFEAFSSLRDSFTIKDLIPEQHLISHEDTTLISSMQSLKLKSIENWDQLNDKSASLLLQDYFYRVFVETEKGTNSRWEYESKIDRIEFDATPVTDEDLDAWNTYLDYEETQGDVAQIISLYERCLIPTCSYQSIWIRYLKFLIAETHDNDRIVYLFNRACDTFVPKEFTNIRYMFAKFYEETLHDFDGAKEVYFSLVSEYPYECRPVTETFQFLYRQNKDKDSVVKDALTTVKIYIQDHYDIVRNPRKITSLGGSIIKSTHFQALYRLLNFKNVSQLIVEAGKVFWLERHLIKKTRQLLISLFKEDLVKSSIPYWYFFFKFELCQRNKKNLSNIVNYIKYFAQMPIAEVNYLISAYNDFAFKNSSKAELIGTSREIVRHYLETDVESSTAMKHFLKSRLSTDRNEELTNKRLQVENGHPSGKRDGRPRINNTIDYTLRLSEIGVPALPEFSNVERANTPVEYIHPVE